MPLSDTSRKTPSTIISFKSTTYIQKFKIPTICQKDLTDGRYLILEENQRPLFGLCLHFKCCYMCVSSSCTQAKLRLEMEMERQRQTHSKEIESKDEEVDEIRRSCSKKVGAAHSHSYICTKFFYTVHSLSILN